MNNILIDMIEKIFQDECRKVGLEVENPREGWSWKESVILKGAIHPHWPMLTVDIADDRLVMEYMDQMAAENPGDHPPLTWSYDLHEANPYSMMRHITDEVRRAAGEILKYSTKAWVYPN